VKRAVFAIGLCAVVPAWAQTPDEDYRSGVAARLAGDAAGAADRLSRVTAAQPDNADAHLQLGLALLAQNRLDEAEASFRRTLEIAPDYADARIGLARLWQRRGHTEAALQELGRIRGANAEAEALAAQLKTPPAASPGPRWRLDVDGAYSALDRAEDWRELAIGIGYRVTEDTQLGVALETARRFGRSDIYGEARIEHRLSDAVGGYVLFGGTPEADFRPRWQIGAGGSVRFHAGPRATLIRLDARHADYPAGDIQTLTPGIEQYLLGGRAWITAHWINLFEDRTGRHEMGWLARGDVFATDRLRLFAGAADAPDVSEGVAVETFSLFGGANWQFDDRRSLRFSLAREDRASGADRITASLGLGFRF
jgi:YaiO family outer membrane protein